MSPEVAAVAAERPKAAAAGSGEMADLARAIEAVDHLYHYRASRGRARLPTFIGVGAGRSGTTTLYRFLRGHPDVHMSPVKEINYFGLRSRQIPPVKCAFPMDYSLYFLGHDDRKHVGEISPAYLHHRGAAEHMKDVVPDAQIIIQIREPVERFVSQFKHHRANHGFTDLAAYSETALAEIDRIGVNSTLWYHPAKSLQQSSYATAIERYVSLFGRDNVLFLVYDDLAGDPERVQRETCNFLGIPLAGSPIERWNESRGSTNLPPHLAERLRKAFEADIHATSRLIDRDLTGWLAPRADAAASSDGRDAVARP